MRALAAWALLLAATSPALGQAGATAARTSCMTENGARPAERIAACDAVIAAGDLPAGLRAIAHNNRGLARQAQDDRAGALADFEAAIRLDPRMGTARLNRGNLRIAMGDAAGARTDFDAGIRAAPRDARLRVGRGNLRRDFGDVVGALADYNAAIGIDGRYAAARNNRANLHRAAGRLRTARSDYQAALRIDPDEPNARGNLCITRARLREPRASEDCERGIRQAAPDNAAPHVSRAGLRMLRGDEAGAAADLEEALRRDPRSPFALQLRALLNARRGDAEGAARDHAAARAFRPRIEAVTLEIFGPEIARR